MTLPNMVQCLCLPESSKITPTASVMLPDLNTTEETSVGLRLILIPKYSISSVNSSFIIGIIITDFCACGAKVALMESDIKSTPLPVQIIIILRYVCS